MTEVHEDIRLATKALKVGAIIAYPTEAVFGLGCDPFNESAVAELRSLKNRDASNGFILIASNWDQLKDFVDISNVDNHMSGWPGPLTKIFPASRQAPQNVCAQNQTIAVRLTNHPIAKKICAAFGGAIVSTSANEEGMPPATTSDEVEDYFPTEIEVIVDGPLGNLNEPTRIINAITGEVFRD